MSIVCPGVVLLLALFQPVMLEAAPAVRKGVAVFQQGVDGYTGCRDSIKGNMALLRSSQPQAGYTLWWSDLTFDVAQVRVLSARVELNFQYEADYTPAIADIQCFRSVGENIVTGKPLNSVRFLGALVKDPHRPSKTRVYYTWDIPAEWVQSWLLNSSATQGVVFAARAVDDSKKGTFCFHAASANPLQTPRLVLEISYQGVRSPTLVTELAGRTVGPEMTLDFNVAEEVVNGSVFHEVQILETNGWVDLKTVRHEVTKSITVDTTAATLGDDKKIRYRLKGLDGEASAWQEAGPFRLIRDEWWVWSEHSSHKIRPGDVPVNMQDRTVQIQSARNEYEAFQVAVHGFRQLKGLNVTFDGLTGPDGARIPGDAITVYRQAFVDCSRPTGNSGLGGVWPDGLIPDVDDFVAEKRNAFPCRVDVGKNQPIWIDVFVAADTSPGLYVGAVVVQVEGVEAIRIPVELEVWPFTLPVQPSMKSVFGSNPGLVNAGHKPKGGVELTRQYFDSAARHRVSLHIGGWNTYSTKSNTNGTYTVSGGQAGAYVGDAWNGTQFPNGATFRPVHVSHYTDPAKTHDERVRWWRGAEAFLEEKGWLDDNFVYVWDEPTKSDFPKIIDICKALQEGTTKVEAMVTTEPDPALYGLVDIWCPVINYYKPEWHERKKEGEKIWWYPSNMSHQDKNLPDYGALDHQAMYARILPWVSWSCDIDCILYFDTMSTFHRGKGAWTNTFAYGGNGDGQLFYPGRPDVIGGVHHIPVETIRLKMIRESFEDYEYLALLKKLGGGEKADAICLALAKDPFHWEHDPAKLYKARATLAAEIMKLNQPALNCGQRLDGFEGLGFGGLAAEEAEAGALNAGEKGRLGLLIAADNVDKVVDEEGQYIQVMGRLLQPKSTGLLEVPVVAVKVGGALGDVVDRFDLPYLAYRTGIDQFPGLLGEGTHP